MTQVKIKKAQLIQVLPTNAQREGGVGILQNRQNGEFYNHGFWLDPDYDWKIVKDSAGQAVLLPLIPLKPRERIIHHNPPLPEPDPIKPDPKQETRYRVKSAGLDAGMKLQAIKKVREINSKIDLYTGKQIVENNGWTVFDFKSQETAEAARNDLSKAGLHTIIEEVQVWI